MYSDKSVTLNPNDEKFPVDAIVVPESSDQPIILIEVSTTHPRTSGRIRKCLRWFADGGIIDDIESLQPGRSIVVILCFDDALGSAAESNEVLLYQQLEADALAKGVRICVLRDSSLEILGLTM